MALAMAAAGAATAAAASKSVFDYNRENFKEDREQRMKKEFAERRFRVAQASLWREDVRGFVDLTERKMSIYLLVNVLMLGFTLNLWCEGRLPEEETPEWLMMGNQLAIVGAFCFLLLTVWLAMHASVAAQSYQTRVLTQLVRLPIPSWDELEACRTYASEFEKLEPRQMFRVPFMTGTQEEVLRSSVPRTEAAPAASSSAVAGTAAGEPAGAGSTASSSSGGQPARAAATAAATDPWGLERRGDDTVELGCHIGSDVAKLRHIKLMRQAAVYWQTYDAFARVSMSIGVNQLMLAMSYYILGYALTQVGAPIAAFAGVIILVCTAEVVAQIDLTLPVLPQRIIQFLLILGPTISCCAAYHWSQKHDLALRIAECLAPVAFFSHGIVVGLLAVVLRVREQENGAMLPLAFQGVLFLDVFGWVWHKHATPAQRTEPMAKARLQPRSNFMSSGGFRRLASFASSRTLRTVPEEGDVNYYAMDYLEGAPGGSKRPANAESEVDIETGETGHAQPAVASIVYDSDGRPEPTRPEEMAKPGSVHDLRSLPGAPNMWDEVNALEPPAKDFWSPVTFMPPESRRRHKMDEFLGEHVEAVDEKSTTPSAGSFEDTPIKTGHDKEMPGVLPWQVFKLAASISSLSWILAGVYFTLHVNHIWTMELPWWWEIETHPASNIPIEGFTNTSGQTKMLQTGRRVVEDPNIMGLWAAGLSGGNVGPPVERLDVAWPYTTLTPRSLACEPSGQSLVVTDGLSAFVADLRPRSRGKRPSASPALSAEFKRLPHCPAMSGTGAEDASLHCQQGPGNTTRPSACEVLVLHTRGRRLSACPVKRGKEAEGAGYTTGISGAWLSREDSEQASWLLVNPACAQGNASAAARGGCTSIGTTRGRIARLKARASGGADLVPVNVLEVHSRDKKGKQNQPVLKQGTRHFTERYLGVLQPQRRSIRILDTSKDGAEAGTLLLPIAEPISAFCAGGGYAFLLGNGQSPGLWRFQLPAGGLQPGVQHSP